MTKCNLSRRRVIPALIALLAVTVCMAGIRGAGKYSGVVVFDRWGGCTLYSGIYVMYVSESVKEGLRPYAGKSIEIDAKRVFQPMNPGDGLIQQFDFLGLSPTNRNWVQMEGLELRAAVKVGASNKPVAMLTLTNTSSATLKLFSQELAITLLTKRQASKFSHFEASDGPSFALITRQSFEMGGSEPRWQGSGIAASRPFSWTIGKDKAISHDFLLAAGESKTIEVQFDLPDGEYEFLGGYGGGVHEGRGLASNLSGFDIVGGKARLAGTKSSK